MLKVFRDNLKYLSWVLWLVIAVFILFVFVDFGSGVPRGGAPSAAAITVGEAEISFGELQKSYQRTQDLYHQAYGDRLTPELIEQLHLPQQVMNQLVSQKLMVAEAESIGIQATDAEVRARILEVPGFQDEQGHFVGGQQYSQILTANGYTEEGFEQEIRHDLLLDKLRRIIADSLWIPDDEVEQAYRDQTERAKIRYVHLPAAGFSDQVELSDEELAAYFADHEEDFRFPQRRVVDYLLVDTAEVRAGIELDDEELKTYYDTHVDEFSRSEQIRARHILIRVDDDLPEAEAERKIGDIKAEIEAGGDFAEIAGRESADEASAANGGDLGYFGRGQMVPAFETAAFDAAPGTLVGPIRTPFGFHLIEVIDHRPAGTRSFDEVRGQIQARLLAERTRSATETRATELAERLRREKVDSSEAMEAIAAETDATRHVTTPPFGRTDDVPEIGRSAPFTDAAFELEEGAVSEPVQTARGWAVLRLAEIQDPRLPELDEVREAVRSALRSEREVELARAALAATADAASGDDALTAIAEAMDLTVEEPAEFARGGIVGALGANAAITDLALGMDPGALSPVVEVADGVVLFEVIDRKLFDAAEFAAKKDETFATLRDQRVNQLLGSMLESRREATEISYSPQILKTFDLQPDEVS